MIPNHKQFIDALLERRKVSVRFYSQADNGVLDRVCAPIDYGPGEGNPDGLNRYWLWDYSSSADTHILGLLPQQTVDLQVLGASFDPEHFGVIPWPWSIPRDWGSHA